MSIRSNQVAAKNRPYWVWIWQGDLSGGGVFGAAGGWVRYDQGHPGTFIDLNRDRSVFRCVANCNAGNVNAAVYEYQQQEINRPITNNSARPPGVTAFVPRGLPGQTGPITSFFPPIEVDIDCQLSPLRIEGGQIPTLYDITISAQGFIRDFDTKDIIIPFNVSTTLTGPGPIAGYTVSQYTFGNNQKDLRAVVYYTDAENNLGDFSKDFRLSLSSLLGDSPNITLEGFNYYFDIETVLLDNLVRTDGIDDQCGSSGCELTFEINREFQDNLGVVDTIQQNVTLGFPFGRIEYELTPPAPANRVFAVSKDELQSVVIYEAFSGGGPSEYILSAVILDVNCTYDVNGQLPGCFIETPETCNVTISDQSGVIFNQTYFGRPDIEISSEGPPQS